MKILSYGYGDINWEDVRLPGAGNLTGLATSILKPMHGMESV